jgi:hypothetical protein
MPARRNLQKSRPRAAFLLLSGLSWMGDAGAVPFSMEDRLPGFIAAGGIGPCRGKL